MATYHIGIYPELERIPHTSYSRHQQTYNRYNDQKIIKALPSVSLPPSRDNTIYNVIKRNPEFQIMANLIEKSNMKNILNNPNIKTTFFAVPDSAFYKLPGHMWHDLDLHDAQSIVSFHTVKGLYTAQDMAARRFFAPNYHDRENLVIDGRGLTVHVGLRHLSTTVNPTINTNSKIIGYNQYVQNGCIHVISLPVLPMIA